ncbi:PAN2-PAN3 deadenylation complex subunit PAN3 isoform X2 [Alligator mississippiensis]|uniref:PAN2-PAN3 deadenylation complex subunit PAN3 isoform X2 n=1 Tax=Alligator mississippiensis TaxID=8496 RepID=UPI00287805D6|nr:PAN2-PAN3 deadenylation complex subunit PAN3 isoform X2 [Alligator mississippiensis]
MNSGGLPCPSPAGPAAAGAGPGPGPGPGVGVPVPVPGPVPGGGGVKLKFCRYYAKDKTCFYGEECQFLHEEPGAAPACPGPPALGGLPLGLAPAAAVAAAGPGPGPGAPYPPHGAGPGAAAVGPKKAELGGGGGSAGLDGARLAIAGMDGGGIADAGLTDSYFSTSFIGVNGFGSPAEAKYPMMQRMTNSSSSPSLLNESAKQYAGHDPLTSPNSSLFNDFAALSLSQRRKPRKYRLGMLEERIVPVGSKARKSKNTIGCLADRCKTGVPINMVWWNRVTENNLQTPNPTASEFIPKGGSTSRLSNVSQSSMSAFSQALFSHPSMGSPATAGLAPGMSLSAGSSPLHSPKITPHTSPAPRRRSHTPNPANYMVPTSASTSVANAVSQPPSSGQVIQKETVGGTTYFYTDTTPAPLTGMVFPNYHIYPPTAPHVAYMQPKANAPSFFMADELRQELINRHLITMAQIDQADIPVPTEVDSYHSLFPLEPLPPLSRIQKTSNFGYITSCYKAVNSKDDLPYCLRRIHGFRLVNTKCMVLVDMWKKIQHSNIVTLREVFTTKAFGEHSLVFAYDFHAGGETMMSRHFNDPSADAYFTKRKWGQHDGPLPRQHAGLLPESLIWAYIVQLSSALRTIHTAGLACRVMDPSKILVTGKTRLRVNCVGIFDVLTFDNSQNNPLALMAQFQQADLMSLGKVVLALACNCVSGIQRENLQKAMELVTINYSSDLKNLILYLLTDQNRLRSVNDIMPMIGARFYTQLDAAQMRNDVIEEDLAKEVQNGRLFRLLAKLGTINERPEFQKDPTWSETGDRYLLKLFRDHLFHQVTEAGTPWIDLSHIISCLNKLDAGVPEKISLISRDEKSVLVVTYSDLKRCFENTFQELIAAANGQL